MTFEMTDKIEEAIDDFERRSKRFAYAIAWIDKRDPKYSGLLFANGTNHGLEMSGIEPRPFDTRADAEKRIKELELVHHVQIVRWRQSIERM